MDQLTLARLHGLFNAANGLWPLAHMRSFERVFGPKHDKWLVRTVAGLMLANGGLQLAAPNSQEALAQAGRVGIGTAATLAAIDIIYASPGRISRIYLLDAAAELGWILLWLRVSRTNGHDRQHI